METGPTDHLAASLNQRDRCCRLCLLNDQPYRAIAEHDLGTGIAKAFPGMPVEIIAGGHDHNGDAKAPLDAEGLRKAVAAMPADAFAIAAAFAVRNPAHEHQARDIVVEATGRPVTLSTELTSALDAPRRALTAVLNARLISRISTLITAVRKSMADLKIDCPLMVVKGDGTLALAEGPGKADVRKLRTTFRGGDVVMTAGVDAMPEFIKADIVTATVEEIGMKVRIDYCGG